MPVRPARAARPVLCTNSLGLGGKSAGAAVGVHSRWVGVLGLSSTTTLGTPATGHRVA